MALAAVQAALARLCTDAEARAALRADPAAFARQWGLSLGESADLAREVLSDAEAFARTLHRKRQDEAARAMPVALQVLGSDLGALFQRYAAGHPLGPNRNPALDALDFHRWVLASSGVALGTHDRDALRYEAAWLTMQHTPRNVVALYLFVPGSRKSRRSLVVWWRWCGRLCHWKTG